MLKAKDIMCRDVVTVSPDSGIAETVALLLEKRINGLPVVDGKGRLVGIICQSDLIAQQKRMPIPSVFALLDGLIPLKSPRDLEKEVQKIAAIRVAQAMTPNPVTVGPESPIEDIATLMVEKKYHTLPVIEDGQLVGIIGKEDVLRTLTGS
ncbi:MAG: CBS domain-containing protein [Syntrophobacteraceae bacterium]|jgi:CBS-domain-containing membrane protein|nr:CBS domain-containing protein [Syntrophobacteraceae bacterium]